MSFCFKVRGPNSPSPISIIVTPTLLWGEFKLLLKSELQLSAPFEILTGFPATVNDFPDDQPINNILQSNETIRVQLKSVSGVQIQGTGKVKPSKKVVKASSPATSTFGAKIKGIKTDTSKKNFLTSNSTKRSAVTSGLQEPNVVKRRRKSSASNKISSEGDIAEHLLSAVSGGTGLHNRTARKVFRNAVVHQYNSSQAVSRVNAAYAGKYTIKECGGILLTNSSSSTSKPIHTHIEVTYNKGSGSRGNHIDNVELLTKELLREVLKVAVINETGSTEGTEEGREALKPMNLSRCSPRIFWSIIYHYGSDLIENIRSILSGIDDCLWLEERKRELSEKAKLNLQQQEEEHGRKSRNKINKKKEETILSTTTATPATPAEETDPLKVWLLQQIHSKVLLSDFVNESWYNSVRTLLGEEKTEGELVTSLAQLVCTNKVRNDIINDTSLILSLDQLESWIITAQLHIFHIIWRIICGNGSERLRYALYTFRIRRPRDFRVWTTAPEGLLQGLLDIDGDLKEKIRFSWDPVGFNLNPQNSSSTSSNGKLDAGIVANMCTIAAAASSMFPWMDSEAMTDLIGSDGTGSSSGDMGIEEEGENEEDSQLQANSQQQQEQQQEEEEEMPWQYEADAHTWIHQRVRVIVENEYWEDGSIIAYLPPEPEEPMALWRIRLDSNQKIGKPGMSKDTVEVDRFEDMEEHEILEAIEKYKITSC